MSGVASALREPGFGEGAQAVVARGQSSLSGALSCAECARLICAEVTYINGVWKKIDISIVPSRLRYELTCGNHRKGVGRDAKGNGVLVKGLFCTALFCK